MSLSGVLIPLQRQAADTLQHLCSLTPHTTLYASPFCHEHVASVGETSATMTRGEVPTSLQISASR